MKIQEFLNNTEFENIDKRLKKIKNELEQNSFNLFTISSYNSYLENFHSDVIAILLNPNERHNQKNLFLDYFLDYLIQLGVKINKDDYALSEITREKGRIDIWIKDNTSKKSIIIENKINNAEDQDNQIENYYNYVENSGFQIDSIIYLTLNGNKKAPLTERININEKIINIASFSNSGNDICKGWLHKCYDNSNDEDNRSFIYQYLKLIKHLSQIGMDKQIKDDFYSVINNGDGFQKTKAIAELVASLEEYRADLFASKIGNEYLPFKKNSRYRPNHWLYENFFDNGIVFKLDVYFHSDGSARLDFWNPNQPEETQKLNVSTKLKSIGLIDDFEFGGFGGGMYKAFELENYNNIGDLDIKIYEFTKNLFEKLRE